MKRRNFLFHSLLAAAALGLPVAACKEAIADAKSAAPTAFRALVENLLKKWCDGMLSMQIDQPDDLTVHGALGCPACDHIHGRCMDSVYPFVHMARKTGEERYLTAAIRVMEWAENNVSQSDGSWTVMPNPKTWRGISVFGAIALAETLHHHGDFLPEKLRAKWTERLSRVGEYLLANFNLTFTNINYGFTALHAFVLIGEVLGDEKYAARAQVLGRDAKQWFTRPNFLLFGEGKPSDALSPKGLHSVDLGYNVEESLNGVVHYALHVGDEELLGLLTKSLEGHLEFMLPDGGWDNSWGTRQAKWSYWGSRTTDGSQPAFSMMADRNPAFATAAIRTTELLQRCTAESGLIYGGLHYAEHGIPPCIHHTFAHAKPLTALLDGPAKLTALQASASLPRQIADGVRHKPEVDVWLVARGPWRATVSTYDFIYKKYCFQGTGGALNILWHEQVGLLFAASMAKYILVEKFNQQLHPDEEEYALTPRLETFIDGKWYTNLYDLGAKAKVSDDSGTITSIATVQLLDENQLPPSKGAIQQQIEYHISKEEMRVVVPPVRDSADEVRLVLPVVSPNTDEVVRIDERTLHIIKPTGMVRLEANVPLQIDITKRERIFNLVPGVQALPIFAEVGENGTRVSVSVVST
ncbi:hypothetical protein [Neolewinella agarilytica]|uniref:hypothetical protein n=1 Tax=Neolewinella agarilytica TaxID=478744 RepID=UPI0023558FD0|nr:hypothetical protein [Neolewinella agarilytica]